MKKPVIVLAVHGTCVPQARRAYDHIDAAARNRYPNFDIQWAFTSSFMRKRLAAQQEPVRSVKEVLVDASRGGYSRAVVQSLHVVPGRECDAAVNARSGTLHVALGEALLCSDTDTQRTIDALHKDLAHDGVKVIAAHGSSKHPEFNERLLAFTQAVESQYSDVVVCSLEGVPGTEGLARAKRLAEHAGAVHFIPLMVVAGGHITNDIMGDRANSWKRVIGAESTTCAAPLGYQDAVLDIYFDHLDRALRRVLMNGS